MYIENPYLPKNSVKLFLVDRKANKINLNNYIKSYEHSNILKGIDTHPDMTFCPLKGKECIVVPEAYEYYNEMLLPYGYHVIKGNSSLKKEYPYDIAYNCVILDNKLFHNLCHTDEKILEYCKANNIEPINVKQGYTKCSTLIIDEKSVITCDKKLDETYKKHGIDSLLVDNKCIKINGFDHGFIGGCGGKVSNDKIAFFGELKSHTDNEKIIEFLISKNISYISLSSGPLFDYGSLIPLIT